MCGRFVDPDARSEGLDTSWLKIDPFAGWQTRPLRYNIKPTQEVWTVSDAGGAWARWWLIPSWHKGDLKEWKATTFNARIEDAASKPSFRGPWKYGRCLIPASGYYEWTGDKGKKQPHFIRSTDNVGLMWMAGLTSVWQDQLTCTIVTCAANDSVSAVHHRMPVIMSAQECRAWLDGTQDLSLGDQAKLRHHAVAKFGLHDDGEALIEDI